ncbi:MAG: flagellar basal body L-ring protein FlgH, partial [Fimbriimonadales bacterium]|nr:flagellar basal body L-ring protein FlgH [Fimbriimonadales bacterium]
MTILMLICLLGTTASPPSPPCGTDSRVRAPIVPLTALSVPRLDTTVQATDEPALERDTQATGSLWNDKSVSLFEDFKARRVGDLLTIVVAESTTASARANTAVQKSE